MINYGNETIFDGLSALESFNKYAADADPVNLVPPTSDQFNRGVAPLNTLPAPWFNLFHQRYTVNLQMAAQVIYDLYAELIPVLTDAGLTPSSQQQNQLRNAIWNIVDTRTAILSDKTVNFTAATVAQALASGDTLATLFSKLAYWRPEYTNLINTHKAIDAAYDTKGHVQISATGGLTISGGVLNLQAATTGANGYMSSTDKQRLDNVYQAGTSLSISAAKLSLNKANAGTVSTVSLPKTATVIVGFTDDCDVKVPATGAQTVINNAIAGLTNGGKVVFREGTYNLSGRINVALNNITLEGMGNSTIFNAQFNNTSTSYGIIYVTGSYCKIKDLVVINSSSYSQAVGIWIGSSNNTVTGNTCSNSGSGSSIGIYLSSSSNFNTVTGNTCSNSSGGGSSIGIYLSSSSNNTVTGNTCSNSGSGSSYGIYLSSSSNFNTVTGNTCSNSGGGSSIGIYLSSSSNNTVTGNTCSNSNTAGQTTTNTFALYVGGTHSYNLVHTNNFTGVTRATSPGSAYTTNGSTVATMIGTIGTQGTLGTGGSMGFNLT